MLIPLPPVRPRLIGLDLDGTVLNAKGEMPPAMLEALLACRAAGIELAFLTGRRPTTARAGLELYLDRAAVCTNSGCLLWDYPSWEPVGAPRLFPRELLEDVVAELAPWSLNLYHDDASTETSGRIQLKRESTPEYEKAQEMYGLGNRVIHSLDELGGEAITQVALPGPRELAESLAPRIRARFGEQLLTLVVRWPLVPCHALELFHPDANKGRALAHFADSLGVAADEVLAAGDDSNDLAMLRWAGWAVAMPHSEQEVRDECDVVLEGEDGQAALAEYLQRLASTS